MFEVLLIESGANDYILDEAYSETGQTSSGSYDRAFDKSLKKFLETLDPIIAKLDLKKKDEQQ